MVWLCAIHNRRYKKHKTSQGLLYMSSDTHWNSKGAYFAFIGLMKQFDLDHVTVKFENIRSYKGDLVGISELKDHPISHKDNWREIFSTQPSWTEEITNGVNDPSIGPPSVATNPAPLMDKEVWIIGDYSRRD